MNSRDPRADLSAASRQVQEYWDERARSSGSDRERVDSSRRAQAMRFEAFVVHHRLQGRSVLDVGCGVADLRAHLGKRGIDCQYAGLDISPEMIRRCGERFPDCLFTAANLLEWTPERSFDYVVSFGIHNSVRLDSGAALLEAVTRRQFELCAVAAHVSLLTDRYQPGFAAHMTPWHAEEVLTFALSITPYVVLRHDYLPNDFSVTLYREPLIDTGQALVLE